MSVPLPELGRTSVELVSALSPPVAALIALIAVGVNMFNTSRQIKANAKNLKEQLTANAENMKRQLDASAASLKQQLESQAREANASREAQFRSVLRAERRETLTKAAEVVHKLQDGIERLQQLYRGEPSPDRTGDYETFRTNVAAARRGIDTSELELHYIATTLEMIDLGKVASQLREYGGNISWITARERYMGKEKSIEIRLQVSELLQTFAASLRS